MTSALRQPLRRRPVPHSRINGANVISAGRASDVPPEDANFPDAPPWGLPTRVVASVRRIGARTRLIGVERQCRSVGVHDLLAEALRAEDLDLSAVLEHEAEQADIDRH